MFRRAAAYLALTALLVPACKGDDGQADEGDEPVLPYDEFPGLSAEVEIHIDDRGIPHIYGAKDDDVAFASGYQMASDRLFQMDLMRRRALGRQAEILGEDFVDQDVVSRTFDLRRWGIMNMDRAREEAPDVYNMMVSWLAGVNQRIAEVNAGDASMPEGFTALGYTPETWELEDEFAIAKLLYLGNSNFSGWQIADADWTSKTQGLERFVSAQNNYSLLERNVEREVLPACEKFGLGFLPFFPFFNF